MGRARAATLQVLLSTDDFRKHRFRSTLRAAEVIGMRRAGIAAACNGASGRLDLQLSLKPIHYEGGTHSACVPAKSLMVARELTLSFVPDAEQRLWRTVTRGKYQLRCDRVRLQNPLESLLEEAHIKLSSLVTDLLGVSARRMLKALGNGETDPA